MAKAYKTIRIQERVLKKLHSYQWPRETISAVIERIADAMEMRIQEGINNPPKLMPPGDNHDKH